MNIVPNKKAISCTIESICGAIENITELKNKTNTEIIQRNAMLTKKTTLFHECLFKPSIVIEADNPNNNPRKTYTNVDAP